MYLDFKDAPNAPFPLDPTETTLTADENLRGVCINHWHNDWESVVRVGVRQRIPRNRPGNPGQECRFDSEALSPSENTEKRHKHPIKSDLGTYYSHNVKEQETAWRPLMKAQFLKKTGCKMRQLLLHSSTTSCLQDLNKASFGILSVTDHSPESTCALCPYKHSLKLSWTEDWL